MTRATAPAARSGFGLIELLVVLAIITTLAALSLIAYPAIRDQDKARDTATLVGITLKDAQARAAKKKGAVGVRFVVAPAGPGLNPKDPENQWVTELELVELPDPLVPNLKPLSLSAQNPPPGSASGFNPDAEPRVRFFYTTQPPTPPGPTVPPPTGAIAPPPGSPLGTPARRCYLENLTVAQVAEIQAGCTIVMPVFGTWHKIINVPTQTTTPGATTAVANPVTNANGLRNLEVELEVFPDANMGGATNTVTYHFAIYLLATPLVGEKPIPLPTDICVDLNLSVGPTPFSPVSFDVIFGPDGKLVGAPNGQLFLWVRNYTKPAVYTVVPASPGPPPTPKTRSFLAGAPLADALRLGGEQRIISISNTGALGHAAVNWPNNAGSFPVGEDFYSIARKERNQD